jgi:MraZ protein
MSLLVGQAQHSLDVKGRLILPVKYRPEFERGGYLTLHPGGCIALWTIGEFTRKAVEYTAKSRSDTGIDSRTSLSWSAFSTEVEVDRQGRFLLPSTLRDLADLQGDVIIVGHFDHIELWSPERFMNRVAPAMPFFAVDEDQ